MSNDYLQKGMLFTVGAVACLSASLSPGAEPQALDEAAQYDAFALRLVGKLPDQTEPIKLCVLSFSPYGDESKVIDASVVVSYMESALTHTGKVKIITRNDIQDLETEGEFQKSGLVEDPGDGKEVSVSATAGVVRGSYLVKDGKFMIVAEVVRLDDGSIIKDKASWAMPKILRRPTLDTDTILQSIQTMIPEKTYSIVPDTQREEFITALMKLDDGTQSITDYPYIGMLMELWCAKKGTSPIPAKWLKLMIASGAEVNETKGMCRQPIYMAVSYGQPEACRILLEAGAPLYDEKTSFSAFEVYMHEGERENTDTLAVLWEAILGKMQKGTATPEEVGEALICATRYNNEAMCMKLLEAGTDVRTARGGEALCHAAGNLMLNVCRELLKRGADPNAGQSRRSPIACIVQARAQNVPMEQRALMIVANAAQNAGNTDTSGARVKCLEMLLQAGASPDRGLPHGYTLSLFAVKEGALDILEYLHDTGKLGVDDKDDEGNTLMHLAVYSNNVELVKLLLSYHVNATKTNNNGVTPLESAEYSRNTELIELLTPPGQEPKHEKIKMGWKL